MGPGAGTNALMHRAVGGEWNSFRVACARAALPPGVPPMVLSIASGRGGLSHIHARGGAHGPRGGTQRVDHGARTTGHDHSGHVARA